MKLTVMPLIALTTLVCCLPTAAFGATIYDNGGPTDLNVPSDLDDLANLPGVNLPVILADDFSLGVDSMLEDIHWWGSYLVNLPVNLLPDDDFRVELFADASGSPTLDPFVSLALGDIGRTDTGGTDLMGNAIYEYSVILDTPIMLDANTTYHLSIANDTDASLSTWAWAASDNLSNLGYNLRIGDDLPWVESTVPPNLAFELTGQPGPAPVPEPASLGLLGLGLSALAIRRVRESRRRHF